MAATYRGGSAVLLSGTSQALNPADRISGLAVDDLMYAWITVSGVEPATPNGWNRLAFVTNSFGSNTWFGWKQRAAGETSYTWTVASGTFLGWGAVGFYHPAAVGTWSHIDSVTAKSEAGSATCTWTSVSYPAASSGVVIAAAWVSTNAQPTYPTAYTAGFTTQLGASNTQSVGYNLSPSSPTEDPADRTGMAGTSRYNNQLASFGWLQQSAIHITGARRRGRRR